MTALNEMETIGGVPLGLSRDYDHLPRTGPLRPIYCQGCGHRYEDVERLMDDGCRVLAGMCTPCREKGRTLWIAKQPVEVPLATATVRKGDR
jgi:hypothetical protein